MKPIKPLLAAIALAGTCSAAAAQAGFFAIPARPVAYSFADICNLAIEPWSAPCFPMRAADPAADADIASAWARADEPQPAPYPEASGARAVAKVSTANERGDLLSLSSVPEPADWMPLCGVAILALIAKRRRDWSAMQGIALDISLASRIRRIRTTQ